MPALACKRNQVIRFRRDARGFTLIELMLVLLILATLAAIVVPKFAGKSQQAKETAAKTQIDCFNTALDAFEVDNGYYPKTSDGMKSLVEEPQDSKDWRGPYLKQGIPKDPWGDEYTYECPGKHNTKGYDIMSMGPDKRSGTDDDLTNW
jgi:general secretion pathway protein G